jgi:hypothetical protein
MGWRKGLLPVLLALLLAMAPAALQAGTDVGSVEADGAGKALRYVACAGSIVFMVAMPASVFYTVLVCVSAFVDDAE